MNEWYCTVDGKQYGPVSLEELKQWIANGRVKPENLVWMSEMTDWVPASSVPELNAVIAAAVTGGAIPPSLPPQAANPYAANSYYAGQAGAMPGAAPEQIGTGGQTPNANLTAKARNLLAGRWGLPIGFCLLLFLISFVYHSIPNLGQLVGLILDGPFYVGSALFFLTFAQRRNAQIGQMFHGFSMFGTALAAYLLMSIFIFLWMLLLIIPGIIASLAYSQTFYLLAINPGMGAMDAIRQSKQMMEGKKWKLFCLHIRFVGWSLLCLLTLGIGFIWLMPYMSVTFACFHYDLYPQYRTV
ncbi:MAG: DUF975 family protein [Phycisphaerae bacterium]|nr:DUF975 family protein [Phycisphaerae bacterium]